MPPRKGDPFNFDDLYIAAGADGLVKKSLKDLGKQPASTTAPLGSSSVSASKPQSTQPFSTPPAPYLNGGPAKPATTVPLPSGALDFLDGLGSTNKKPAAKATTAQTSGLDDPFHDFGSVAPAPAPKPPTPATADPFAMFDDVPGLQPSQPAAPPPAAQAPAPAASTEAFPGFEDIPAFPGASAIPAAPTTQPATIVQEDNHWGDFSNSTPAPVSTATPAPQPQQDHYQPLSTSAAPPSTQHSSQQAPAPPSYTRVGAETQPSASRISGSYWSSQAEASDAVPAPSRYSGTGATAASRPQQYPPEPEQPPLATRFSDSGDDRIPSRPSGSGGGVVGMLRGFGKKAVRAAQIGLQHLESALEKMDQGPMSQQTSQHTSASGAAREHSAHKARPPPQGYQGYDNSLHGHHAVTDDDPASIALTLLALPADERPAALASLPAPLRPQVEHILSELMAGGTPPRHHTPIRDTSPPPAPPRHVSSQSALAVDIRTNAVDLSAWEPPTKSHSSSNLTTQPARPAAPPPRTASPAVARPAPPAVQSAAVGAANTNQPNHSAPPPPPAAPVAVVDDDHDLLGMTDGPEKAPAAAPVQHQQPAPAPPRPTAAPTVEDHDLLGVSSPVTSTAAAAPQPPVPAPTQPAVADVDDMHDFFSGGPASTASSAPAPGPRSTSGAKATAPAAVAPMVDLSFGLESVDVDISAHKHLYETEEGEEGEPEVRKRLRAARLAEKHAKMQSALASKLAQDEEEARLRQEQVALKEQHKVLVEQWKNKSKGNVRGLLGSLQMVLWEDSGWKPIGMADLLEPAQIRKAWMKANLLVHPDKVRQRNGSPEQVARADMIFDVLKDAWNLFQTTGK